MRSFYLIVARLLLKMRDGISMLNPFSSGLLPPREKVREHVALLDAWSNRIEHITLFPCNETGQMHLVEYGFADDDLHLIYQIQYEAERKKRIMFDQMHLCSEDDDLRTLRITRYHNGLIFVSIAGEAPLSLTSDMRSIFPSACELISIAHGNIDKATFE